jgi:hypothetical protein
LCNFRRKLLAVVTAVKYFHHYLFGNHFIVKSYHGALRWFTNFKSPKGKIASNPLTIGTKLHNKFTKKNNNGAARCQKLLSKNVNNANCKNNKKNV